MIQCFHFLFHVQTALFYPVESQVAAKQLNRRHNLSIGIKVADRPVVPWFRITRRDDSLRHESYNVSNVINIYTVSLPLSFVEHLHHPADVI